MDFGACSFLLSGQIRDTAVILAFICFWIFVTCRSDLVWRLFFFSSGKNTVLLTYRLLFHSFTVKLLLCLVLGGPVNNVKDTCFYPAGE